MRLKEKRRNAFLEYLRIIYIIEEYFYDSKDLIFQAPSLVLDIDNEQLTTVELIFSSIHKIQKNYIRRYSLIIEFLENAITLNKKYKLGFINELNDIQNRISKINENLIIINNVRVTSPILEVSEQNFILNVEIYEKYTDSVFEIISTARSNINVSKFDYRKYFKDDFYKHLKNFHILIDITSGSHNGLIEMRVASFMNDVNDKRNINIIDYYPKNIKNPSNKDKTQEKTNIST